MVDRMVKHSSKNRHNKTRRRTKSELRLERCTQSEGADGSRRSKGRNREGSSATLQKIEQLMGKRVEENLEKEAREGR